eukprot:150951_1
MAEQKYDSKPQQYQSEILMPRWDISVNFNTITYSNNNRTAIVSAKNTDYISSRTVFYSKGRHIVNIKMKKVGTVGVGICSRKYKLTKANWIGKTSESYGTWSNGTIAYYSGSMMNSYIIQKTNVADGDIVKMDLNLYNRTFVWEINGQSITNTIPISFKGDVAICAGFHTIGDSAEIVQYFNM